MKTKLILLVLALTGSITLAPAASNAPLRLLKFDRSGALTWTNDLCTTLPVYDILRANSPTGAWQHFRFVTNADSAVLTNSLGASAGAVFHKLVWVSDGPVSYNYSFTEGYGFPSVAGSFTVDFAGSGGTLAGGCATATLGNWNFHDVAMLDDLHPTGSSCFRGGGLTVTPANHQVQLKLTLNPDNTIYLQGVMQIAVVNGRRTYTGFSGTVYINGFGGDLPIGTFTATRAP